MGLKTILKKMLYVVLRALFNFAIGKLLKLAENKEETWNYIVDKLNLSYNKAK